MYTCKTFNNTSISKKWIFTLSIVLEIKRGHLHLQLYLMDIFSHKQSVWP